MTHTFKAEREYRELAEPPLSGHEFATDSMIATLVEER
jgi:hypothetical protein